MTAPSPKESLEAAAAFFIACVLVGGFFFWALGYHIVHKPTDAQLFGCEHTYINEKGEDTGECR